MKAVKRNACLTVLLWMNFSLLYAQSYLRADDVFADAAQKKKAVLLIFSGSDWCLPCIQLEKTIFRDTVFQQFASQNLVLVKADFPQKTKLTGQQIALNEQLAESFNPNGIFPLILLVKADRSVVTSLQYENYTAAAFVNQIHQVLASSNMMKEYKTNARLMGSIFEFILCAKNDRSAALLLSQCVGEVQRIEALLTEFSNDSETAKINAAAGGDPVAVSAETYQLIERSRNISELTDGAFDISSGLLKKLYPFGQADFALPSVQVIHEAIKRTGYRNIYLLGNNRVQLAITGMRIGFGGIGKGYAADRVKSLMQQEGVDCGVINASGDLTAWGTRPNGTIWKSGIADPNDPEKIIWWLPLHGLSIATSGNYEQYFDVNGARFSHNIDPKTGYPVSGIKSVSIVGPAAELCDALATAVTVMGVEAGLHLIDQLPQTHCIIIDENNHSFHSKQIHVNLSA